MIAHGSPAHRVAERRLIHLEKPRLKLDVASARIRHVADVKKKIQRMMFADRQIHHRRMNRALRLAARARIADDPKAHWLTRAFHGICAEVKSGIGIGQALLTVVKGVEVPRVRPQSRDSRLILPGALWRAMQTQQLRVRQDAICRSVADDDVLSSHLPIQINWSCSVMNRRSQVRLRAPNNVNAVRRSQLNVRPANDEWMMIGARRECGRKTQQPVNAGQEEATSHRFAGGSFTRPAT